MSQEPFLFERPALRILGRGPDHLDITSIDQWLQYAPPAAKRHWREGYSALETARAWLGGGQPPTVPPDLTRLLTSVPALRDLTIATVLPEHDTPLAERGGARRHDLLLLGRAGGTPVVVGVESKTDESFDDPLWLVARNSIRDRLRNPRSRRLDRLQRLTRTYLGRPLLSLTSDGTVVSDAAIEDVPYQLLAGLDGTLVEAGRLGADIAVFATHALVPADADHDAVTRNGQAFDRFVQLLAGPGARARAGELIGPIAGLDASAPQRPLYLGRVSSKLPARGHPRRRGARRRDRSGYAEALKKPVLAAWLASGPA